MPYRTTEAVRYSSWDTPNTIRAPLKRNTFAIKTWDCLSKYRKITIRTMTIQKHRSLHGVRTPTSFTPIGSTISSIKQHRTILHRFANNTVISSKTLALFFTRRWQAFCCIIFFSQTKHPIWSHADGVSFLCVLIFCISDLHSKFLQAFHL